MDLHGLPVFSGAHSSFSQGLRNWGSLQSYSASHCYNLAGLKLPPEATVIEMLMPPGKLTTTSRSSSQEAWLKPESWRLFTKPLFKVTSTIPSQSMPKDMFQFPKWDGSRYSKCYSEMTKVMSQVIPCLEFFRRTHYVQNAFKYCSWTLMPRSLLFTFQSGMIDYI